MPPPARVMAMHTLLGCTSPCKLEAFLVVGTKVSTVKHNIRHMQRVMTCHTAVMLQSTIAP